MQQQAEQVLALIRSLAMEIDRPLRFMEVCGTHTVTIFRSGLRQILPPNISLVSGPGCPVCVTPDSYLDLAIAYAKEKDTVITTFGDMLKVPGSVSNLAEAKADGADIRVLYSPLDALTIARDNPDKRVIFLAVGFETTAPTAAATVLAAKGLDNFFMLSAQKLVPPAIDMLLQDDTVQVDGFILPGHVAVITGTEVFFFMTRRYGKGGVVAGFEPLSILRAVCRLLMQIKRGEPRIENEYKSVVTTHGNLAAKEMTMKIYEPHDAVWRGIGSISNSGLIMRREYAKYDIEQVMPLNIPLANKKTACRCGEVLKGTITPPNCPLFAKKCLPTNPVGPCMASVEGVCAAWHKYGRATFDF